MSLFSLAALGDHFDVLGCSLFGLAMSIHRGMFTISMLGLRIGACHACCGGGGGGGQAEIPLFSRLPQSLRFQYRRSTRTIVINIMMTMMVMKLPEMWSKEI